MQSKCLVDRTDFVQKFYINICVELYLSDLMESFL